MSNKPPSDELPDPDKMKTALTILLTTVLVMGCTTFDRIVGVADTAISVPTAREELIDYLNSAELDSITDELRLLDKTYEPLADAVFGNSDLSLDAALAKAFQATVLRDQLESAYKEVRRIVRLHEATTGEPIPFNLARVSVEIEDLWDSWKSVAATNQRAQAYLRVAGQLVLAL